jgi:pimeloyl-ACP methyl ester carboxylesterase
MPRIRVNGWNFLCRQAGMGPDVLLLPGMANAQHGRLLFDALAVDFRVTVYKSRGDSANETTADMADDLRGLQEKLDLASSFLVAHRLGAVAALHAAVLYPEMVSGLVLSEPSFPGPRQQNASGLKAQRIFLIEQPLVVLCPAHSPFRTTCRILEENLPNCRAALVPPGDGPALVKTIREHLRDMAANPLDSEPATRPRACRPRARGPRSRMLPDESDGRAVARWMTRLSAWMW